MDYIKEINAFYDSDMVNQLTPNAVLVYFALLNIANKLFWKADFTVSNLTLQSKAGIADRKTLGRARNQLIQKGLIIYEQSGRINQAGSYTVIGLVGQLTGKNAPQNVPQGVSRDAPQTGTQDVPINKLNKTKLNETKTPPIPPEKKQYAEYVFLTETEHECLVKEYGEDDTFSLIEILDNYIGQNPKKNNRYTDHNRVIKNWVIKRLQEEKTKYKMPSAKVLDFNGRGLNVSEDKYPNDW